MAGTTDFVPFATSSTANVQSQANYIAATTTQTGFQSGVASSADCNKPWRQSTFVAAGVATFTANQLSINVADDGNLTNFVTNFANALTSNATAAANSVVTTALSTLTLPFTKITGSIANAQVPQSAVTQYQGNLAIGVSQVSGLAPSATTDTTNASNITKGTLPAGQLPQSFTVSGTITAGAFNATSDARLKKNVRPIDAPLERLARMRGVLFDWKKDGTAAAGVIAQEVQDALSVGVRGDSILRVDPVAIIGLLVESLNAERAAREALEKRVAGIEAA